MTSARERILDDLETAARTVFATVERRERDRKQIPRAQLDYAAIIPIAWNFDDEKGETFESDDVVEDFDIVCHCALSNLEPVTENTKISNKRRALREALFVDSQRGNHPTVDGGKNARWTKLREGRSEEGAVTTTEVGGAIGSFKQRVRVAYKDIE